jgi:hypothetical protein
MRGSLIIHRVEKALTCSADDAIALVNNTADKAIAITTMLSFFVGLKCFPFL